MIQAPVFNRLAVIYVYPQEPQSDFIRELEVFDDLRLPASLVTVISFIKDNGFLLDQLESLHHVLLDVDYNEDTGDCAVQITRTAQSDNNIDELVANIAAVLFREIEKAGYELVATGSTTQMVRATPLSPRVVYSGSRVLN